MTREEREKEKFEKMKNFLANLNEEQEKLIFFYCKGHCKKLWQIGIEKWKTLGIPPSDYDDLLDDAVYVLIESMMSYANDKKTKFSTYLTGNIKKSASEWHRNRYLRSIRNSLLIKDGKIVKELDANGKERPVVIPHVWLDAENEDGINIGAIIPDKKTIEDYLLDGTPIEEDSRLDKYIKKIPKDCRKVAKLFAEGYSQEKVKEMLHIESKQFSYIMQELESYENISIFY